MRSFNRRNTREVYSSLQVLPFSLTFYTYPASFFSFSPSPTFSLCLVCRIHCSLSMLLCRCNLINFFLASEANYAFSVSTDTSLEPHFRGIQIPSPLDALPALAPWLLSFSFRFIPPPRYPRRRERNENSSSWAAALNGTVQITRRSHMFPFNKPECTRRSTEPVSPWSCCDFP